MIAQIAGPPEGNSERGAGLAEYALLLALIALACITVVATVGSDIAAVLNTATGIF